MCVRLPANLRCRLNNCHGVYHRDSIFFKPQHEVQSGFMRASISSGARDRASGPGTCRAAQCVFFAGPWTRPGKGSAIAPKVFGACRSRPGGKIIDPENFRLRSEESMGIRSYDLAFENRGTPLFLQRRETARARCRNEDRLSSPAQLGEGFSTC